MSAPIPARLTAGDSWAFTLGLTDYPAPPWSVSLVLTPATGGTPLSIPCTYDAAAGWTGAYGATASALVPPGGYAWALVAADAAEDARATLGTGAVSVCPDPTAGGDPRTQAEKHLAAIDAVLADPSWVGAESYTIEGRSLARRSRADLMVLRAHYAAQVRAERGDPIFATIRPRLAR